MLLGWVEQTDAAIVAPDDNRDGRQAELTFFLLLNKMGDCQDVCHLSGSLDIAVQIDDEGVKVIEAGRIAFVNYVLARGRVPFCGGGQRLAVRLRR